MNEVIRTLLERRSIRSFTDQKIPWDALHTVAEAAVYAPSARNSQKWKFTVVQNGASIKELAAVIGQSIGRSDYNFYNPNALIIASCERAYPFGKEDCACALENVFLAAHSLGIGSVWINQLNGVCDEAPVRGVLDGLKLPKDHVVYGTAALGYAAAPAGKPVKNLGAIEYIL